MKKLFLFLGILILLPSIIFAQNGEESADEKDKFTELTKDADYIEGYLDFYRTDDALYMALTKEQLNTNFLMNIEISKGIGSSFIFGGLMLNRKALLLSLEQREGKIFLVQKPYQYTAKEGTPEARAVDLSYGNSVLETASVEATNKDSVMLVNVYDWFVSDFSGIGQSVERAVAERPGQPGRASFDKSRSYLNLVKSYPENSNIEASLTFRNGGNSAPRTVADGRFIPVSIFYSMTALPEVPMEPRLADDRAGYFLTVHKDFTVEDETFFKRYANRWRLECDGEPGSDGLCNPVKPITYYIDHTVPVEYREAMMEGVEAWSDAYEAAGFRNAVQAEMLPEGAEAGDIRYPTLRWNVSDQAGYGAIGPSVVDPRTGEILDADILFEANMILGTKDDYRELVEPRAAIDQIFNISEEELNHLSLGGESADFYTELNMQMKMAKGILMARGKMEPGSPVPDEFVDEFFRWVTMHEVGHTLGLRHNFRSSVDTPLDKLYDKEWGEEKGVFSSAMEYPTVNISPDGMEDDGYYYNPGVGSYDRWVVSYGYTPDAEQAKEIARQAAQPGHAYGTDGDARGSSAVDPHVNVFDLGGDPLEWAKNRAELISGLIPELPEVALADDVPYYEATDLFNTYFFQYTRALAPAVKYIGGQYQYRDHVGDPDGRMPFVAIEKEEQEEALSMIVNYAFDADAFNLPQEVYQQFGANRWSHWGNSMTYRGRIDYPLHDYLIGVQSSLLSQLLDGTRLSRIRDTEVKFGQENTVTIPELMSSLTNAIWSEVWSAPGSDISSNRRDLQRAYLDEMIEIVTNAPSSMPADARSVARAQLSDVNQRISRRLTPPYNFDAYTEAHLREVNTRIEKALDAGLNLEN